MGKAPVVEPGEFIKAPDVGALKIMVADGVATERAGNGLKKFRGIVFGIGRRLAEPGPLGFRHENGQKVTFL